MLPVTKSAPFVTDLAKVLSRVHGANANLPSLDVLAEAINLAHRLSSQLYEGRPVRSALVLVRDKRVPIPAGVPLEHGQSPVAVLRSLCAAFPGGVVLAPSDDGKRCEVHAGLPLPGVGQPLAVAELRFQCAGVVSVLAKDALVALSRAGEAPQVFEAPHELESLLDGAVSRPRRRDEPVGGPEVTAPDALTIVRGMHGVGSGGTLVLCPFGAEMSSYGADVQHLGGEQRTSWGFAGDQALHLRNPEAIEDMIGATFAGTGILRNPEARAHWTNEIRHNTEALLKDALEAIGRLARADGAIMLRRDMALLAFGVRLNPAAKAKQKPPKVVGLSGEPLALPGAGTRLQGALAFVSAHPECVALVLSADGPLRLVWASNGQVVVQADLEAFL